MNDNLLFEGLQSGDASGDESLRFDTFLRDEGMALLAAYRSIENPTVRKSLRDLIISIATDECSK